LFGEGLCLGLAPKEAVERGISRLGRVLGEHHRHGRALPLIESGAKPPAAEPPEPLSPDLGLLEGDRCEADLKMGQQSIEVGAPPRQPTLDDERNV